MPAPPAPVSAQLRRLHPLTPVFRSWRMIGVAGAAGVGVFRDDLDRLRWIWDALHGDAELSVLVKALLILLGVAVVAVVASWLSWRATGFAIESDSSSSGTLRFHRGLFIKQRSQVRLNRVQSVDVNQPLFPRLAGLAEVKLEMAAGEDASVSLAYLRVQEAWDLRQEILRHTSGTARASNDAEPGPSSSEQVLARVSTPHLVKANLLDGAVVWLLLVVWVVALVVFGSLFGWAGLVAAAAGIVPVTIAIAVQLRQQVLSMLHDANFTLVRTATGIRISSGLTSTINRSIELDRVQGVRLEEPYLWRRLGWARVMVDIAGADDDDAGASLMPVTDRADALRLISMVTGAQLGQTALSPPGGNARRLDPWAYKLMGVALLDSGAVTSAGRWRRTLFYVPYGRVQSVSARQGPVQRRLRLATVYLDLPSGTQRWEGLHREEGEVGDLVADLSSRARAHRRPGELTRSSE
ncbi:MAG: PH domain-containing protein [Nocardioidaceae bacterium]